MAGSKKVRPAGPILIGPRPQHSTFRHWAKSCHAFHYYEALLDSLQAPELAATPSAELLSDDAAAGLLTRAIRLLAQAQADAWVSPQAVWQMILRLDSTFDPKEHGHANFPAMLSAFGALLEVSEAGQPPMLRLR